MNRHRSIVELTGKAPAVITPGHVIRLGEAVRVSGLRQTPARPSWRQLALRAAGLIAAGVLLLDVCWLFLR